MSLYRSNVWQAHHAFPQDVRHVLGRFFSTDEQSGEHEASPERDSQWEPRVDIREEERRFVILADIPGVDPAQIEISMDKNVLSIKGERAAEAVGQDGKFTRVERVRGAFHRRFTLPETIDAAGITATGKFGLLEIAIPKKSEVAPRRITINATS